MSQDLCLKWNNHSSSFVKLLDDLHLQELYSDVTLLCQGKFYPVHRFVLSTCSKYFQEMFSLCKRYSNKYPFIIIKDINSLQMEALLNYMYKGEVNVPQDLLPDLIKAAEVFKIKGLAVQDDEDIKLKSPKRRSNSTSPQPRKNRKIERRGKTVDSTLIDNSNSSELSNSLNDVNNPISEITIKNEPQDIIEKTTTTESEPSENDSITQSHMRSYNDSYDPLYLLKDDSNTVWGPTDFDNYESDEVDDQYSNQMIIGHMATPPGQERLQISEVSYTPNVKYIGRAELPKAIKKTAVRMYQCSICAYTSPLPVNVRRHYRKHTGEKPFKCPKCSHRTSDKANLKKHILWHSRSQATADIKSFVEPTSNILKSTS